MNKILVIGTGSIAQRHLRNLFKLKQKNVYVFSKSKMQKKKLTKVFPKINFAEKINFKNFTHLIFANSSTKRFKMLIKNLNLVKNKVYYEKPLACDVKQLEIIKKKRFKYFMAGFQLRAYPLLNILKKIIKKNIKKLKYCNLSVGHDLRQWRSNYDVSKIYYADSLKYSGVLWELCHEIDIIYYLFGLPKSVYARNLKLMNFKKIKNDYSSVQLDYKKFTLNLIQEMISPIYKRKYEFIFTDKILILDLVSNQIYLLKKNKKKILYQINNFNKNEMYLKLMKNFVSKEKNRFASLEDICMNTKILNSLEFSSKKKKIVRYK